MSSPCPPLVALRPGISHEGGQIQGRRQGRCQVGKAAGYRWKSLSDADKAPYVAKANKLKIEYNKGC